MQEKRLTLMKLSRNSIILSSRAVQEPTLAYAMFTRNRKQIVLLRELL